MASIQSQYETEVKNQKALVEMLRVVEAQHKELFESIEELEQRLEVQFEASKLCLIEIRGLKLKRTEHGQEVNSRTTSLKSTSLGRKCKPSSSRRRRASLKKS